MKYQKNKIFPKTVLFICSVIFISNSTHSHISFNFTLVIFLCFQKKSTYVLDLLIQLIKFYSFLRFLKMLALAKYNDETNKLAEDVESIQIASGINTIQIPPYSDVNTKEL